jgi:hypothetical protein
VSICALYGRTDARVLRCLLRCVDLVNFAGHWGHCFVWGSTGTFPACRRSFSLTPAASRLISCLERGGREAMSAIGLGMRNGMWTGGAAAGRANGDHDRSRPKRDRADVNVRGNVIVCQPVSAVRATKSIHLRPVFSPLHSPTASTGSSSHLLLSPNLALFSICIPTLRAAPAPTA